MIIPQRLLWLALLVTLMLTPGGARAYQHPAHDELPDLDKRLDRLPKVKAPTPAHMAEVQKLQAQVPGVRVEQDEVRGSPKHIASTRGFLTGPKGEGKSVSSARMQKLPTSDPHRSIKAFVDEHAALFGHDASALEAARVRKDFTSRRNGVRSILWEQQVDDIPVFEGVMLGHLTAQGELMSLSSQFIADPVRAADLGTPNRAALRLQPTIAAVQAIVLAAESLDEALLPVEVRLLDPLPQGADLRQSFKAGTLPDAAEVRLTWLPLDESSLRLCWEVAITRHAGGERHRLWSMRRRAKYGFATGSPSICSRQATGFSLATAPRRFHLAGPRPRMPSRQLCCANWSRSPRWTPTLRLLAGLPTAKIRLAATTSMPISTAMRTMIPISRALKERLSASSILRSISRKRLQHTATRRR